MRPILIYFLSPHVGVRLGHGTGAGTVLVGGREKGEQRFLEEVRRTQRLRGRKRNVRLCGFEKTARQPLRPTQTFHLRTRLHRQTLSLITKNAEFQNDLMYLK